MMSDTWRSNLADAVLLDPLVLIHGNTKDVFLVSDAEKELLPQPLKTYPAVPIEAVLGLELEGQGCDLVVIYDNLSGMRVLRGAMLEPLTKRLVPPSSKKASPDAKKPPIEEQDSVYTDSEPKADPSDWMVSFGSPNDTPMEPLLFLQTVERQLFRDTALRVGVICQFVDRYLPYTDRQDAAERKFSLQIQKAAFAAWNANLEAKPGHRLVFVFDTEMQVPQELNTLFPLARSVLVPPPSLDERQRFFAVHHGRFDTGGEMPVNLAKDTGQCRLAAQLADGLRMQDLISLVSLSRAKKLGLGPKQLPELLQVFRFGSKENAWTKVPASQLKTAETELAKSVKGQPEVINEVVPVLIRAKLGMTDITSRTVSSKPRGVFFFVGPTGVGKTELTKAIAELVFGTKEQMLRFDMSEYSEQHQQARLIGAPPGYVGFDEGGQLTNAISEKPFSVVLFDEIEKAHPRILDKFLQILDDGRLTDGMGKTVYFTEAIIIFTSNLGTAPRPKRSADGSVRVTPWDEGNKSTSEAYSHLRTLEYADLCAHFRKEVRSFFVEDLGRPEILNRIGEENVLVFRFLTDEEAKLEIIKQQIKQMNDNLLEHHQVEVRCTKAFERMLMKHPRGFDTNGARGVLNLLNRIVMNRLARELLFEGDKCRGKKFRIDYEPPARKRGSAAEDFDERHVVWTWDA
jgi:energy-coupling factor transporter ATP-binding protein EcfA2